MEAVLEYIMLNYTWIIAGSIIILLAIIGYYADKTNFGQGNTNDDEYNNTPDINSLNGKRLDDFLEHKDKVENNSNEIVKNDKTPTSAPVSNNNSDNNIEMAPKIESSNVNNVIDPLSQSEESFEKFDKEFNELLPKKEIIDDELLDEINNLSLDKTQRIDITDIPDVDDVELPEIKTLSVEEDDVWKF